MDESEFLEMVQERATLGSTDAAQETTTTVLEALGTRVPEENAREIAVDLPSPIADGSPT